MPADPSGLPAPAHITVPPSRGSGAVQAATALLRALSGLGVGDLVLAPGSRSAPLVYALEDEQVASGLRAHVRIDERSAAFTALGISRWDPSRPAAVATTSGTATAHLHAAVMEAHHARVPLLVLTADRPAELRGTGANQTTDQVGLFGGAVRLAVDLPAPGGGAASPAELRTMVSTAARAVAAARGDHPGPVHLNLGFRDPLVPAERGRDQGTGERIVLTHRVAPPAPTPVSLPLDARTVIVAGDGAGPAARELAAAHRLPLLAEPSSGARDGDTLVPAAPQLLAAVMADPSHPLRPRRAVVHGHPTLQRAVVSGLLGAEDVEVIVVGPQPDYPDAARRARLVVPALTAPAPDAAGAAAREEHLAAWRAAGAEAATAREDLPWQAQAALAVWEAAGEGDVLVLGSSSLVRDLDRHAGPTAARVIANRGLAGIDGTTSMAGGVALARAASGDGPRRVRLLCGDLTALHDLTGLLVGPAEEQPALDVVVVDDDGGRIFAGLEHAAAPAPLLRRFFTTPHGADIAAVAAALGASAERTTAARLPALLEEPASAAGIRVLLVQEDPSELPGNVTEERIH